MQSALFSAETFPVSRPRERVLYPRAQWYFLAAMMMTWLGFSRTYFAVIRQEPLLHHIHGALMGGWIGLLIVQPVLYQRGHIRLHRTLGRWAVYLWVPALVVCGFLMDRRMLRTHNAPPFIIDQLAFLDLTSLLLFASLIFLSAWYGRRLPLHARYIVCTVLVLMPPAIARALFFLPAMRSFQVNVNVALALVLLMLVLLMMDDRRRGKMWAPYPVMAGILLVLTVASNYVRVWPLWHMVSGVIAGS